MRQVEGLPKPESFGDYFVHAKIAQGGMADVLLATSAKAELHGQFIAIKRLLPHLNSNKAFVDLLIHEAKVGVLLNHPGIAQVYDLGSYKSDFFISMEYVHGKSLDRIVEKVASREAPRIPLEVATFIILEALKALSFAHQLADSKGRELNIIHRDVSPGNILLSYRGDVKLADFGIATAESRLQSGFTQSAMGKLAYMAPEQAVNDPVVRASDLYSLGVVYFQMLSGQLPFQAENANLLLKKVLDGRVTDIKILGPTIPPGLREIVMTCLNKSSRKRFQSGPELHTAIVEFFQKNHEIDFSSKATRDYYKKKLSEYLRAIFESEIVQEIDIVQSALRSEPVIEELKKTAPQQIPATLDQNFEVTVFEADVTDEATRHYPLTETERQKILKGLPAKEAIRSAGDAFNQPTRAAVEQPAEGGMFSVATIPEFELSSESSAIRRISVKDKLAKSSLSKDQKETLKMQMPAMEIVSLQDLDAFEKTTFGGPGRDDNAPTRPHSRDEILKSFSEIERSGSKSDPKWHPISVIKKEKRKAEAEPVESISNRSSRPSQRTSPPTPVPGSSGPWALVFLVIFLGALGGLSIHKRGEISNFFAQFLSAPQLLPTQKVYVSILGEAQPDQQRSVKNALIDDSKENLKTIADFYNQEYSRYTGSLSPVIDISTSDPGVLIAGISKQENASKLMSSPELFRFLDQVGFARPNDKTLVVYMYLYPFDPNKASDLVFPREYLGSRPNNRGAIFAPAHESQQSTTLLHLARQIALAFGATDKRDPNSGLPLNPEGLADPKLQPIFPQAKAELMALEIAVSPLQKRAPTSLKEVVIGPKTAYEFGWISSSQLRDLMP